MHCTDYHAKYFAYELTRRSPPDSVDKLGPALVDAQVDLNPHQVDAALFAFNSPLSQGALLADEVGLGKTIEAGLVLAQKWAEKKRRILIIVPANLRKQWYQELTEKFFLNCRILETSSYKALQRQGQLRPFELRDTVLICSYAFARNKADDIRQQHWDLVVLDEAHRLRNVYKPQNVVANTIKDALAGSRKLLLTATPLQNSLLELYGLVSFIDEHAFGDLRSFREQFANLSQGQAFQKLRERLAPICHRTLRRQVLPYIKYTRRIPLVERFSPDDSEERLYNLVSEYLQRENLQALPASQRTLTTLVLRKLLASSTFAIEGALLTIAARLQARLDAASPTPAAGEEVTDELAEDYEGLTETADEWPVMASADDEPADAVAALSEAERRAIELEIADLNAFAQLAGSIQENAKGRALLTALRTAFAQATDLGAARKAIIFTESRRTQNYLLRILSESEFGEGIVLFNGSNNDADSQRIYREWVARHRGTDRVTGARTADMRSALVDYFRSDEGNIMIATEAGAEGINLQFCSLVVNYDLPWNPQRIEQRIGRCHRYGQKHDVVVVNFLNRKNAADQRVFELLEQKFQLFEGVFGASDEVLGTLGAGVDFEKRIAEIYQTCRQPAEIEAAFNQLQTELRSEIDETMRETRNKLLTHFDEEVSERLRLRDKQATDSLDHYERLLLRLTRHELRDYASFGDDPKGVAFDLHTAPPLLAGPAAPLGRYELPRRSGQAHLYRLAHPLAQLLLQQAKRRPLPLAEIQFDYAAYDGKISPLENLRGQAGWLRLACYSVEMQDQGEDYLLFAALTDEGEVLADDVAERLFKLPAQCSEAAPPTLPPDVETWLAQTSGQQQAAQQAAISERNAHYFALETDKLDNWAEDVKTGLERAIRELDRQIREARRAATAALSLEDKLTGQKQVKTLETQRNQQRRALFDAQDEVDIRREQLIADVEKRLKPEARLETLLTVRWVLR